MKRFFRLTAGLVLVAVLILMAYKVGQWQEGKSQPTSTTQNIKIIDQAANQTTSTTTSTKTSQTTAANSTTTSQPDELKNWQTFNNTKYNYSFKYPDGWQTTSDQTDYAVVGSDKTSVSFAVRTGQMSSIGFESYNKEKEEDVLLAGESAKAIYYQPGQNEDDIFAASLSRLIVISQAKNADQFVIMYSYPQTDSSNETIDQFKKIIGSFIWKGN